MGEYIDFAELYALIGTSPGCNLQQFQLAYRRRVAILHPDHQTGNVEQLQRINALYSAAIDFHARTGRLPGARAIHGNQRNRPARTAPAAPTTGDAPAVGREHRLWWLTSLLIALLAWTLIATDTKRTGVSPSTPSIAVAPRPPHPVTASDQYIALGMEPTSVVTIEGHAVSDLGQRWHYGPSWITFRCGVVSDWYSSPLRPLHVRSPRPRTVLAYPAERGGCGNRDSLSPAPY